MSPKIRNGNREFQPESKKNLLQGQKGKSMTSQHAPKVDTARMLSRCEYSPEFRKVQTFKLIVK